MGDGLGRNNKKRRSAHLRGAFVATAVILFFLGVIFVYYSMLRSETRQKIIKSNELSSVAAAEQINKYLSKGVDTIKLACYTLDNMIRVGSTQDEIHSFLVNQSAAVVNTTSENSTGIYGYIRNEYLDGTDWVPGADYVPTERPWYTAARAYIGRVAVVDPYVDAQTGTVLITFSKTLCDGKSVAAMDFSMDQLQEITAEVAREGDLKTEIVLDQQYQVIAHSDKNQVGRRYLEEEGSFGNALVNVMRTSESDEGFFSLTYDGAQYMVYAVSVSNDWICISVFDATSTFSQLNKMVMFTMIISLLVVIILSVIFVLSNRKEEQFNRLRGVVEALAAAIDAKDTYTNGHSGRVADYAREISRRAGYTQAQQDEIYVMGLLHDVGKIGISDAVINKPGKLTDEEFEIIKTHPTIGSQILSTSKELEHIAAGARWHHERYGGGGYPDGISGEEIPEEARIIAVADAYDAMTSTRSYRDVMPQDKVRSEIEKGLGTQFDPVFGRIMLEMIDEDEGYEMHEDAS
ncbi:MAG: HD domain-containing protein [Coriobacteriales bacterium]|nr:HD domain-containing protein [Coriobacteriales bacterium]